MSFYEWTLRTPVQRDFVVSETRVAERFETIPSDDPEQPPTQRAVKESFTWRNEVAGLATAVRLVSATNDSDNGRFFVRFIYGRYEGEQFARASRDDGIVIGGPNYYELLLDPDSSIDEPDLLKMCARILKWDGEMRELSGERLVDSTKITG